MQSTRPKPTDLKSEDLQLVAERLALIQGHISHMPTICISGATVMNGFLLVASHRIRRIEYHFFTLTNSTHAPLIFGLVA